MGVQDVISTRSSRDVSQLGGAVASLAGAGTLEDLLATTTAEQTGALPGASSSGVLTPAELTAALGLLDFSIKVAKNRRSATLTLSCPAKAPKTWCSTASSPGKKAFARKAVVVPRDVTQTVTVNLTSATAKRLKKEGGAQALTERSDAGEPEDSPGAAGHGSPLNYYVPGVCVTGVGVTLPTTGTGCGHEARTLPG